MEQTFVCSPGSAKNPTILNLVLPQKCDMMMMRITTRMQSRARTIYGMGGRGHSGEILEMRMMKRFGGTDGYWRVLNRSTR